MVHEHAQSVWEYLRSRPPTQWIYNTVTVTSVLFWAFVLWYAATQQIGRAYFGVIFLGWILFVYVLNEIAESVADRNFRDVFVMIVTGTVTTVSTAYIALNHEELYTVRVGYSYDYEYILALVFVAALLYLTWRAFGKLIPAMGILTILYGLLGPIIPGIVGHGGLNANRMLQVMVLDGAGIFGTLNRIIAAWVAIFLLYAGLMHGFGAFDIIIQGAAKASKYTRSGSAQAAVASSAIVGSINGSATANAAMTGSITIPMMKENGLRPATAAGIESSASTIGQVLPPVMGSSAFLMAGFLAVPYADVMYAAAVPALVLIAVIAFAVHLIASRELETSDVDLEDIDTAEDIEKQDRRGLAIEAIRFAIPFIVLVYTLGIAQYTIQTSALYTCITMFATGVGFPLAMNGGIDTAILRKLGRDTVNGLRFGAVTLAPIAIIVAMINGMVDVLMATGVPGTVTLAITDLAGGSMFLAVLIAMIVCLILGLGMPNVAAYALVAILVAPTLIESFAIPEFATHLFVFYSVVIGGLTPPVAIVCAVAAGIADAKFMDVCWMALRIFGAVFIIPFAFVFNPELVSPDFGLETLYSAALLLVGAIGFVYGVNYRSSARTFVKRGWQGALVAAGVVTMVYPGTVVRLGVGVLVLAALIIHYLDTGFTARLTGSPDRA